MGLAVALAGCGGGSGDGESAPVDVALSGVIDIEAGTRVDSDNADVLQNASVSTEIQDLPQEFVLAGYASGASGNYPPLEGQVFPFFEDVDDQYAVESEPGFEITLQAFQTRFNTKSDLKLTVVGESGEVTSEQTIATAGEAVARVVIPSDASLQDYAIQVTSLGPSPMLYILSAQRVETLNASAFDWPSNVFVPNEAIVSLSPISISTPNGNSTSSKMRLKREIAPGIWTASRASSGLMTNRAVQQNDTMEWIKNLRNEPAIRWASPNYIVQSMNTPVDEPLYPASVLGQRWHYELINGPLMWQLEPSGGEGVPVAVLDTGLFFNRGSGEWHRDLAPNVGMVAFDAVDGDAFPEDPGSSIGGSVYHGTHVAGTIAAAVNGEWGAGVAFNSTLVPVRVLNEEGTGTLADLIEAVSWISGEQASDGEAKAEIVNLSLGGLPCGDPMVSGDDPNSLQSIIDRAVGGASGILFVAAAGNTATSEPTCPAALEGVISVSAVDAFGKLTYYSNYGDSIDIAAPGGNADAQGQLVSSASADIVDGRLQEVYRGLQGTSMAAPHVAGVLTLMKHAKRDLNYYEVISFLLNGDLTDCGTPCARSDELGYGLLDGAKAMESALSGNVPHLLTASPTIADLRTEVGSSASAVITFTPLGDYSASVTRIAGTGSWFAVDQENISLPFEVSETSPLTIGVSLSPDQLEPGVSLRGSLVITYDSETETDAEVSVPVIGQLITDEQAKDAGRHFVLLVDPVPEGDIFTTVSQATVDVVDGQYQFSFRPDDGIEPRYLSEVPPGTYFLVAGSDLDNDGLICHAGEACAEYPVSGLREEITITAGEAIQGIRMTTSYSRPTISAQSPDVLPRPGFEGYRLLSAPPDNETTKSIR
ncbi:hypothetical protein GCM10009113_09330 [Marinobacter szutsaonensis]